MAGELGLSGWVRNSAAGVEIEVEGESSLVDQFPDRLARHLPAHASIDRTSGREVPVENGRGFCIKSSVTGDIDEPIAEIIPDLATCSGCLEEILDPSDRRYGYPFTNCTHCGPRFSIVQGLPYDRVNTTMEAFTMCGRCREEYESPSDRRFHAQPNACPDCGPQLSWLDGAGKVCFEREAALEQAALAIERGEIVAVKGIGGFHLFADAHNSGAIGDLRQRKHRPAKPLALMAPSLDWVRNQLELSALEADWLTSSAAPIVVLQRKATCTLPESLAPNNPGLGVMLPYSPLHHILMRRLGIPVVTTSGNRGDEPICIENVEAVERLSGLADGFLVHDRGIVRPVDDSVVWEAAGRRMFLRRSRGFAPAPISIEETMASVIALGGDLKNSMAVTEGGKVRLSQHLGDLASLETRMAFERHVEDFPILCGAKPRAIICDRHPGYHSQSVARMKTQRVVAVQHHHAHAVACAAENGIGANETFLGVVWDGTGYGEDGTIWGGEFLLCQGIDSQRYAWLRPFPLPGGEKAVVDPRFAALGCLHEAGIPVEETPLAEHLKPEERRIGQRMIDRGINTPRCSSAGRLFDAISALCGLCFKNEFEGQAPQALEFAASHDSSLAPYPLDFAAQSEGGEINWSPLVRSIVNDLKQSGVNSEVVSGRFHLSLAELIANVAVSSGCQVIALSGGCFQNRVLLELTIKFIKRAGLRPIWHQQVPSNDGGLALGQTVIASRRMSLKNNNHVPRHSRTAS